MPLRLEIFQIKGYFFSFNLKNTNLLMKHLGLLNVGDNAVFYTLNNILEDPKEHELIRFETAKTLILLGN